MSNLTKPLTGALAGLLLALASGAAQAVLELVEQAVEAVELEVRVDASRTGYAIGARCDTCRKQRFTITPETVYVRNAQRVDPSQASSFSGRPGTIIYDIETREVTKILQVQ